MRARCPHCGVPLPDPVSWSGVGLASTCTECTSTFVFRFPLTASEREARITSAMLAALVEGPLRPNLGRWIRAWGCVVRAYHVERRPDDAHRVMGFVRHLERCRRNSGLCRAVGP